jgi:hypothetical protein
MINIKKTITKLNLFLVALLTLPLVSAYTAGPFTKMINLWDLLVVQIFGSFWPAVFFLTLVFFIILMLAGISLYTVIIFNAYFLLAMSLGYGYPIVSFILMLFGITYFLFQFIKLIFENR